MSKTLIIAGMHRSGTSLLARYLYESGLFIGSDLLGTHRSNPAGHFEDRAFLSLHNGILAAHHRDYKVTSPMEWNIDPATRQKAIALIDARSSYPQWGWKDPRTCLFLPFWKKMLPEACFLITYRSYSPTVSSMIARDILMYREKTSRWQRFRQKKYGHDEIRQLCNLYLSVWMWYNQEILTHLIDDPHIRHTVIAFEELIRGNFSKIEATGTWGFDLHPPASFNTTLTRAQTGKSITPIFDTELMQAADIIAQKFEGILGTYS